MFTKLSILYQYLRIAVAKPIRLVCWILMGFTVANALQTFLTGIWGCVPVSRFWNTSEEGHCLNKSAVWFANAGINIIQDIALIVIPMFLIKDLMLPKSQKIVLFIILALGGLYVPLYSSSEAFVDEILLTW
jgi:hypothetical protein